MEKVKLQPIKNELVELPKIEKEGKFLFFLGTVFGLFILVGVLVLTIVYIKVSSPREIISEPVPTPTIAQIEKMELKREEISFEVLNASGIKGQATKYKNSLEKLGYKVNLVGNKDGKYEGVSVYIKSELDPKKELLMSDLKKEYPLANYLGELKDSANMVRLIVGR